MKQNWQIRMEKTGFWTLRYIGLGGSRRIKKISNIQLRSEAVRMLEVFQGVKR